MILTLINDTNILYVIFAWIIIKQKSSDDILNGINKLEGLLIVSIFQIYKEKENISFHTNSSSCDEETQNMENLCDFLFDENFAHDIDSNF